MGILDRIKAFIRSANELDTGNDGYVVSASNSGILPIVDNRTVDSDTIATSVDGGLVIDLPSVPSSMNEGNAAAPSTAAQKKGLMMFNFNHTEEELRFIIQAVESKIAALQSFLQKLVMTANAQAQAQNGQSAAAADANPSMGEANAAPVSGDSADAGASTATA